MNSPAIQLRPYQRAVFRHEAGLLAWIWRRQCGKSHGLGAVGLDWMMEAVCDVLYFSAAVALGQENIRKEAALWREGTAALRDAAEAAEFKLETNADDLDLDATCELFEANKLETKLWHSRSRCSRSIVRAPNPSTAVGWTGHVILDEVGRMPNFADMWESVEPIVSSDARFRVRMATTPPPDDSHYSYELLAPETDEFPVNPAGSFYTSMGGILVHRLDAWDANAAGIPLYDLQSRQAITPEESRAAAIDKTAWDRNYGCKFIRGGAAALSLIALNTAQQKGAGCTGHLITESMEAA